MKRSEPSPSSVEESSNNNNNKNSSNAAEHAISGTAGDSSRSVPPPAVVVRVRLMSHAVDGTVPFLTPALLHRCFPADAVRDVWMLGLAVRDTCVVPVFGSHSSRKTKQKTTSGAGENTTTTTAAADSSNTKAAPKPRGYSFSGTIRPDPWLLPYARVTVPTFDALDDDPGIRRGGSSSTGTQPKNDGRMALWTSNGRQSIAPAQYRASVHSLGASSAVVPLFWDLPRSVAPPATLETTDPLNGSGGAQSHSDEAARQSLLPSQPPQHQLIKNNKRDGQRISAVKRTMAWTEDMIASSISGNNNLAQPGFVIWAPLPVDENDGGKDESDLSYQHHLAWIADAIRNSGDKAAVTGIALVGWHRIRNSDQRDEILRSVVAAVSVGQQQPGDISDGNKEISDTGASEVSSPAPPTIAILSTTSTRQILQILLAGSSTTVSREKGGVEKKVAQIVIGSDLPALWARAKCAFLLDLSSRGISNDSRKRARCETSTKLDHDGCISLDPSALDGNVQQHPWFRDKAPMMEDCLCLTCRTHSRAYIYHLVCAKELLAEILLFIHNLHHLLTLIRFSNDCQTRGICDVANFCQYATTQMTADDST